MKKIILFAICSCFLFSNIYAQGFGDAYGSAKNKIVQVLTTETEEEEDKNLCPIYADTPMSKVERAPWELVVKLPFMDFPVNGPPQFRFDNFNLGVIHNVSSALGVYITYGQRASDKYNYENSNYDPEWETVSVFAGIQFYITPIFKIAYGIGYISAEDKEGNTVEFEMPTEYIFSVDQAFWDGKYKLTFFYSAVRAPIKEAEGAEVSEAIADGSYSQLGVALVFPFGY